jgi:hypothetical protein
MVQSRGNDQELKQCTTNMRKLVSNVGEVLQRARDNEIHYCAASFEEEFYQTWGIDSFQWSMECY